jgi:hypothetical protein
MRRTAGLLLVVLAGCSGGGSGPTGDPDAAPAPTFTERCHTPQLQARVQSTTAAITVFSLTDSADVACVLEGYARLELLDRTGAPLAVQPTRLTDVPIRRLTLTPGTAAAFELHTRTTTAGGSPCTVVSAAGVRITPPDETDPLTVDAGGAAGIAGCEGQYGVTAMHAGP